MDYFSGNLTILPKKKKIAVPDHYVYLLNTKVAFVIHLVTAKYLNSNVISSKPALGFNQGCKRRGPTAKRDRGNFRKIDQQAGPLISDPRV